MVLKVLTTCVGTRCYVYSWARVGGSGLPKVVDSTTKLGRAERFGQKRAAYKRVETEPGKAIVKHPVGFVWK